MWRLQVASAHMAFLFDLSTERLLEIIACLYSQSTAKPQHCELSDLSTTCKPLNICCNNWIFKKYVLRLRAKPSRTPKNLTPLDNLGTFEFWSADAVTARLSHLREKAVYVKEFILEDNRSEEAASDDEPGLLPDFVLPDLLDTLKGMNKVTALSVKCGRGGVFPLPI